MKKYTSKDKKINLCILAPHVVQYHTPLYREIANYSEINLLVLFCADYGYKPVYDPTMKATIQWDTPLLEGFNFKFMKNLSKWPYIPIFGRINLDLFKEMINGKFDVILIQDYYYLTSWLALFLAKILNIKIIFRGEGTLKNPKKTKQPIIKKIIFYPFMKFSDAILFSCSGNKQWLVELGSSSEKMSLIPCSVDNIFFNNRLIKIKKSTILPKEKLGLDEKTIYIISVARMYNYKRIKDIVYVINSLQRKKINCGLILVGDGPDKENITRIIIELDIQDVILPGFINSNEISLYYAASDIFVLTSDYDPSPKSLSEALIFSLPIVGTNVIGTYKDLIIDDWNGFSFDPGDLDHLEQHLQKLISDEKLRKQFGRNSRLLSEKWSIQAAAESVVKVSIEILSEG
jgi:glycosyltransferase involved in cell wall biosynthesis